MNYVGNLFTQVVYDAKQWPQYPKLCREEVSIHLIQSREHILNTVRCP